MNDINILVQMGIAVAATVAPVIFLVRLVSGSQQVDTDVARAATGSAAWPIGVQEEDPLPWRFTASTV